MKTDAQRRPHLKAVDVREKDDVYLAHDDDFSGISHARQERQEKIRMLIPELIGRWYWIVLGLGLGVFAGVYVLSKTPKEYTAISVLELKQASSGLMGKDNVDSIDVDSIEGMNTIASHIVRAELLGRVAERDEVKALDGIEPVAVDWKPDWYKKFRAGGAPESTEISAPPEPAVVAGMMSSWLEVSLLEGTRLMEISVTHQNPEVSRVLADAIAKQYLEELADEQNTGRSSSIGILEKQSAEARTNLQTATGSLAIYNRAIEIHRILDEKEADFNRLKSQYRSKHPKFIAAEAEIKNLERQFLSEYEAARKAPNEKEYWRPILMNMPDPEQDPDKYFLIARQQLLARIGVLESEIRSATSVFNGMLTLIEESLVDQQRTDTSAKISSLASLPSWPSAPNSTNLVGMFGFAGLSGGLLIAFVLTMTDNRFHTVAQFSGETGANVLASVSNLKIRHLEQAERSFLDRFPDEQDENEEGIDDTGTWNSRILFRKGVSYTNFAEMYRVLRASVSLLGDESDRKVTLFSSALPGEGKTITSVNFALAAAAQGKKTLLVDLDLRRPSLHKAFGMKSKVNPAGGVCELLADKISFDEAVFHNTGLSSLDMMLAGKRPPNPGESINSSRVMALLAEARSRYDVIVLDSAPVLPVPDTRVIAPLADNFCIVCRANYVPKGAVKDLLEMLEEDGTEVSGFVFNGYEQKRRLLGDNRAYGYYATSKGGRALSYGYGSYGAYGSDYED